MRAPLALALLVAVTACAQVAGPVPHPYAVVPLASGDAPPPTQSAFVMTAFTNGSQSVMNVYDSVDGKQFFQRKAPAYRPPQGDLIRDPSVMKHSDGWYYVTYTTGWKGHTIGLARSRDLMDWHFVRNIDVPVAGQTHAIVKVGARYHNFIKNETTKYIEHMTASALDGPWTRVGAGTLRHFTVLNQRVGPTPLVQAEQQMGKAQ